MRFFVPQATKAHYEDSYQAIIAAVKDQMGWRIMDRKIFRLRYLHNKKKLYELEVGQLDPYEQKHEIMAILESQTYIAFTRTKAGVPGPTILVSKLEVEATEDFD